MQADVVVNGFCPLISKGDHQYLLRLDNGGIKFIMHQGRGRGLQVQLRPRPDLTDDWNRITARVRRQQMAGVRERPRSWPASRLPAARSTPAPFPVNIGRNSEVAGSRSQRCRFAEQASTPGALTPERSGQSPTSGAKRRARCCTLDLTKVAAERFPLAAWRNVLRLRRRFRRPAQRRQLLHQRTGPARPPPNPHLWKSARSTSRQGRTGRPDRRAGCSVRNKFFFTNLNEFDATWILRKTASRSPRQAGPTGR